MILLFLIVFLKAQVQLDISQNLHDLCLERLSFESSYPEIYQALICGKRLPFGEMRDSFIKGGLIHLMVISGAHLIFLEYWLSKLPFPSKFKKLFLSVALIIYALISLLHPPVLRALFAFFLRQFSEKNHLFWGPFQITLLSAVLCCFYVPNAKDSFSLQLSVLATLLFHFCKDALFRSFVIYLFVLPIINHFHELSSLSVLINWILAPFISSLLFPLSFLTVFCPFLYPFTDSLWFFFLKALKLTELLPFQYSFFSWALPRQWIWFYILGLWFLLFHFQSFLIHFKIKKGKT